jgi:peroxiredoxin family protein
MRMSKPLVIFLHSDGYDRIYQAVNMTLTAASAGRRCYLFLFYQALGAYMAGAWDEPGQMGMTETAPWRQKLGRSFETANVPSLYELLKRARRIGGEVSVYACSNSMQYLGLDPTDVKNRVDEIVGLATMLEVSSSDCQVFYI